MFQITIDDVLVVRNNVAVSGKCVNRNEFSPNLIDDDGTEYVAAIPFIKYVVPPELDYITLELKNIDDPKSLKGRVLRGINN
ncbi:MAG: hypothetical protein FWF92_07355 [Oscillospiraceae bacterium]|nr:hypothetical protein [Oscillospiraceae bacterium]